MGDYYYIHQFAGQVLLRTDSLAAVGLKAISESIRAYTICVPSVQLSASSTILSTKAAALDAQVKFVNTLETHIRRPIDLSADIARYYLISTLL